MEAQPLTWLAPHMLEPVASLLEPADILAAMLVCKNWNRCWRDFVPTATVFLDDNQQSRHSRPVKRAQLQFPNANCLHFYLSTNRPYSSVMHQAQLAFVPREMQSLVINESWELQGPGVSLQHTHEVPWDYLIDNVKDVAQDIRSMQVQLMFSVERLPSLLSIPFPRLRHMHVAIQPQARSASAGSSSWPWSAYGSCAPFLPHHLRAISACTGLTSLVLSTPSSTRPTLTVDPGTSLRVLSTLQQLTHLVLSTMHGCVPTGLCATLAHLTALRSVELACDIELDDLPGLAALTELTSLRASGCTLGHRALPTLACLPQLTDLELPLPVHQDAAMAAAAAVMAAAGQGPAPPPGIMVMGLQPAPPAAQLPLAVLFPSLTCLLCGNVSTSAVARYAVCGGLRRLSLRAASDFDLTSEMFALGRSLTSADVQVDDGWVENVLRVLPLTCPALEMLSLSAGHGGLVRCGGLSALQKLCINGLATKVELRLCAADLPTTLTQLCLDNLRPGLPAQGAELQAHLPQLRVLKLGGSCGELPNLSPATWRGLRHLKLAGKANSLLPTVAACTALTRLSFACQPVTGPSRAPGALGSTLCTLRGLRRLVLRLDGHAVDPDLLRCVASLPLLSSLSMSATFWEVEEGDVMCLSALRALRTLRMAEVPLSHAAALLKTLPGCRCCFVTV